MTTSPVTAQVAAALKSRRSAEMYQVGQDIMFKAPLRETGPLSLKLANALLSRGSNAMAISLTEYVGEVAQTLKEPVIRQQALVQARDTFNKLAGTNHAPHAAMAVFSLSAPNSKKFWQPTTAALVQVHEAAIQARNPRTALEAAIALTTNTGRYSHNTRMALPLVEKATWAANGVSDYQTCIEGNVALVMLDPSPQRREQAAHNLATTGYAAGYKKKYDVALTAFENAMEIADNDPDAQIIVLLHANTLIERMAKGRKPDTARALCESMTVYARDMSTKPAFKAYLHELKPESALMTNNALGFAEKALAKLNERHQRMHGESVGGAKMA